MVRQFREGKAALKAAREASGCEALYREEQELLDQAAEVHNRIVETQATSLAGVLGQLKLLRDEAGGDFDELVDSIVASIKNLFGGFGEPEPRP